MPDDCTLWYEEWEMACCGRWFALGSRVIWPVSRYAVHDGSFLPEGMEREIGRVDYAYDAHGDSWKGLYTLTGTVKRIRGVYFCFEPDPEKPGYLRRVSGFLTEMEDCDYWTAARNAAKRKGPRPRFDAYIVHIEPAEIRPAGKGDRVLWT